MNPLESIIIFVTICFLLENSAAYVVESNYWADRSRILKSEQDLMIGGDVKLDSKEQICNQTIMKFKIKEVDAGFENLSTFLPAQNFLVASEKIEKSEVFQIIKKLPKGAVLHVHDMQMTSFDYVYENLTHRPNLYVCDVNGTLRLQFFDRANTTDCNWRLLVDARKADGSGELEGRIKRQMTMVTSNPYATYPDVDASWNKFRSIFVFTRPLLTYRPVFEDYLYQGLLELYEDNVQYAEIRSLLLNLYDLDGSVYGPVKVAEIFKNVVNRFVQDHPDFMGIKLIYSPLRNANDTQMDKYLSTARKLKEELPDFVVGFDLVGQEDKGEPLERFANKLRELGDDVQFFFHAGETNWYRTSSDQNLVDAVLLNTKRIGHGYTLLKHPELLKLVRERKIAIEVNPISNQVWNLVKDLRNHPASVLFSEDYPVVISNDNPELWGAKGLSYDFYEAFVGMMSRDADLRALKKLALNSIEYSCLSEEEKKRALKIWSQRWDQFLQEL